jgi:hypothetical protein
MPPGGSAAPFLRIASFVSTIPFVQCRNRLLSTRPCRNALGAKTPQAQSSPSSHPKHSISNCTPITHLISTHRPLLLPTSSKSYHTDRSQPSRPPRRPSYPFLPTDKPSSHQPFPAFTSLLPSAPPHQGHHHAPIPCPALTQTRKQLKHTAKHSYYTPRCHPLTLNPHLIVPLASQKEISVRCCNKLIKHIAAKVLLQ